MTMTAEAPVWGVDLVGRPAVFDGQMTTVTEVRGGEVFTAAEPGRTLSEDDVVTLPVTGEFVEINDDSQAEVVRGFWLGPVYEAERVGEQLTALVLVGATVRQVTVRPPLAEARRVVTSRAAEAARDAMAALLGEVRAHQCTHREHHVWVDRLVADAHSQADDRGWCNVDCTSGVAAVSRYSRGRRCGCDPGGARASRTSPTAAA